jgi:hypothetical protein
MLNLAVLARTRRLNRSFRIKSLGGFPHSVCKKSGKLQSKTGSAVSIRGKNNDDRNFQRSGAQFSSEGIHPD